MNVNDLELATHIRAINKHAGMIDALARDKKINDLVKTLDTIEDASGKALDRIMEMKGAN